VLTILIPEITIITGFIVFSLIGVYVSNSAKINNKITVSIIAIILPFEILIIFFLNSLSLIISTCKNPFTVYFNILISIHLSYF